MERRRGQRGLHARSHPEIPRRLRSRPLSQRRLGGLPLQGSLVQRARQRQRDGRRQHGQILHFGRFLQRRRSVRPRQHEGVQHVGLLPQVQLPLQRRGAAPQIHQAQRQPGHHLRAQERTGNGGVDDLGLCGQIGSQRLSGRLLQRPAARPRHQQRREPLRAADADRLPREVLQHGAVALLAHAGPRRLGNQRAHRHRQRLVRRQELQPSGTHQDTPAVHGQRPRRVRRPDLAAEGYRRRQPDLLRVAQRLPFGLPRSVGQLGALLRQARPLGAFPLPAVAAQQRRNRQVAARTGPSLPAPGYRRTYHVQLRQPLFHRG